MTCKWAELILALLNSLRLAAEKQRQLHYRASLLPSGAMKLHGSDKYLRRAAEMSAHRGTAALYCSLADTEAGKGGGVRG